MIIHNGKKIIDSPESDRFEQLFGKENLKAFRKYKNMNLSPSLITNNFNINEGQTSNMLDFNYWNGSKKKGWAPRNIKELEYFFKTIREAINEDAPEGETPEEETTEEEVVEEAPEEEIDPEKINPTPKVPNGPGIEYIGCDSKYRVYHVTTKEGAKAFGVPAEVYKEYRQSGGSRGAKGWCITGSGAWAGGNYWYPSWTFFMFMTEPYEESWCFYFEKSNLTSEAVIKNDKACWCPVDADTNNWDIGYPPAKQANLPLYLVADYVKEKYNATIDTSKFDNTELLPGKTSSRNNSPWRCSQNVLLHYTDTNTNYEVLYVPAHTVDGDNSSPTIKIIGSSAFSRVKVKKIILTSNVDTFKDNAFYGSIGLTEIECPSNRLMLGKKVFKNCDQLKYFDFNDIDYIPDETFSGCSSLQRVTLPNNITSIGTEAFRDCKMLTVLNIPKTCQKIAMDAFYGCKALTLNVDMKRSEMPSTWYKTIFEDVARIIWLPEDEEKSEEIVQDSKIEDYDPYEFFRENTIAQDLFAKLVKIPDSILANANYGIYVDYNLVKKFWAKDDEEAKAIYEEWKKEHNNTITDSKKINDEEMVIDTNDAEENTFEIPDDFNEEPEKIKESLYRGKRSNQDLIEKFKKDLMNSDDPTGEGYDDVLNEINILISNNEINFDDQELIEEELWDFVINELDNR